VDQIHFFVNQKISSKVKVVLIVCNTCTLFFISVTVSFYFNWNICALTFKSFSANCSVFPNLYMG